MTADELVIEKCKKYSSLNSSIDYLYKNERLCMAYHVIEDLIKERDEAIGLKVGYGAMLDEMQKERDKAIERNSELKKELDELEEASKIQNEWLKELTGNYIDLKKKDHYPRWVDVNERLPKDQDKYKAIPVIVKDSRSTHYYAALSECNFNSLLQGQEVTHWLEEEPEQKETLREQEIMNSDYVKEWKKKTGWKEPHRNYFNEANILRKEQEDQIKIQKMCAPNSVSQGNITDTTFEKENPQTVEQTLIKAFRDLEQSFHAWMNVNDFCKGGATI